MRVIWFGFVCLALQGCWLSADEWGLARNEAQFPVQPLPSNGVPDLGLGACVDVLFDNQASGDLPTGSSSTCAMIAESQSIAWSVPDAGCWEVIVESAGFEALVATRESCAVGADFCSDDGAILVEFDEQPVVLEVASLSGTGGPWTLNTRPLTDIDLQSDLAASGDNVGRPTRFDGVCGVPSTGDVYVRWVATRTARWRFDLGVDFDATFSLHRGCDLSSGAVCAIAPALGLRVIEQSLEAGQEVVLRISSTGGSATGGSWTLQIEDTTSL